jgi:hypothetical protein
MISKYLITAAIASTVLSFTAASCSMNSEYNESPIQNFEALWTLLDQKYCFFEYKHIDWQEVHDKYAVRVHEDMTNWELFNVCSEMLAELRDGHINLYTNFAITTYDGWYSSYPSNFSYSLLEQYCSEAATAGSSNDIRYTVLADGRVGYVYYGSFSESILESELDSIYEAFKNCDGVIVDVRNNTGGSITNSDRLASRFTDKNVLCGYIRHNTGAGHNDFSEPYPIYLKPAAGKLWLKPAVVLTNRRSFSAANNFVSKMSVLPRVKLLGDVTGGGSGFPITSELPNGWEVRLSSSPILDVNMQQTEFGITPDIRVNLLQEDEERGFDTLIESAITCIFYSGI